MTTRRHVLALAAGAAAAPFAFRAAATEQPRLKVVATFSILADMTRQVGGARIDLATLVGPEGDTHVFSPTADDARKLSAAALVVTNGLGLEGWLERLVKASGTRATTVVATTGIQPLEGEAHDHAHADGDGHDHAHGQAHDHGGLDPHAWQDVANAKIYVANIRDGLIAADPQGKEVFAVHAHAYLAKLDALDAEVRAMVAAIPQGRRRIITAHDAFGYFGRAYGIAFISPQGVSTEAEASAKDVGRIIRQIKAQKVPAVFLENIADPRLAERIAKEGGAKIGGRLYSDALSGATGPAGTYIDMVRHNIRALSAALMS